MDALRALRARLVALADWFNDNPQRLVAAQAARPRDGTGDWRPRVLVEIDQLLEGRVNLAPPSEPAEALRELEALDEAAWLAGGAARLAPPDRIDGRGRPYHVVRLARPRTPLAARQANLLYTHLRHHALVPVTVTAADGRRFDVRIEVMRDLERCTAACRRGEVRVATTSFADRAAIEWASADGPARGVATAAARADDLARALAAAGADGVDILIAPELTVPPAERDRLIRELRFADGDRPALVVPGSFHDAGDDGQIYNRALLIDGRGNTLIEHRKLVQFGQLDRVDERRVEAIQVGNTITVLVTPIGTVAVAICKDFLDVQLRGVWQQVQPEWLLVVAYGEGVTVHEQAARDIALVTGTTSVLAHEPPRSAGESGSFVFEHALVRAAATAPAYTCYKLLLGLDILSLAGNAIEN